MGLATSEEIYQVLIPPLSHFDKLPNEAMADWFGEKLKITPERRKDAYFVFTDYTYLIKSIQDRKAQDRFANRATAIIVNFLLQTHEKYIAWTVADEMLFEKFNNTLRQFMEDDNKAFLMSLRSLSTILRCQGKIEKIDRILTGLGLDHLQLRLLPSASSSEKEKFTFPNSTDVFGWSKESWKAFDHLDIFGKRFYETVDIAGQSLLHNAVDGLEDDYPRSTQRLDYVLNGFARHGLLRNKQLLTAQCDEQTPLHRAAKKGQTEVVERLLSMGLDPNAKDFWGRTALCFAVQQADPNMIDMLCEKMKGCLDQQDYDGHSALHYAIVTDQEANALNLVWRKVKIHQAAEGYRIPLSYAIQKNMNTLVKALIDSDRNKHWIETAKKEAKWYGCEKVLEMVEEWEREEMAQEPEQVNSNYII